MGQSSSMPIPLRSVDKKVSYLIHSGFLKTYRVANLGSVKLTGEYHFSRTPTDDSESPGTSSADDGGSKVSEKSLAGGTGAKLMKCAVLGFATEEKFSLHGDEASEFAPPTEAFLQRILYKYPRGHVFYPGWRMPLGETGAGSVPSKKPTGGPSEIAPHEDTKALLRMLPGAQSVLFVPLWDSHKKICVAGSFVWTVQSSTRVLKDEDLSYLAAFGNIIMTEVSRLDAMVSDEAKSDFISSISHELRSPLHGILASAELLLDTEVNLFQNSMIDTIERCGRTLLDTIQHVLVFAKINNISKRKKSGRKFGGPGERYSEDLRPGMLDSSVDVDISLLAEDVINSMFVGHKYQGNSLFAGTHDVSQLPESLRKGGANEGDGSVGTALDQPGFAEDKQPEVTMDIDWRPNWTFTTQSGALRRVLMNLFGNALKYTDSGYIKISVRSRDIEPTLRSQAERSIITISVSDSGRGIGREYLHSGLFEPFTQEDSLNAGTGLGLSIVLRIVRSLGGTIDVTSEKGVGTEVVVSFTLDQAPCASGPPLSAESLRASPRELGKILRV